jgi:hypothetical protein
MMKDGKFLTTQMLATLISAAAPPADYGEPYRILQQANLALDPALATSAYASNAQLIFEYPGQAVETFQGRDAILTSYVRTFGQVNAGTPIKLDFRFEPPGLASDQQAGVYRINATAGDRPVTLYGRFSVKLVREAGAWRFAEDRGMPATAADFDRLPAANLDGQ